MPDIFDPPENLPFPPAPSPGEAPMMCDCRFLEMFHIFDFDENTNTALAGCVANHQYDDDYSENDYHDLRYAAAHICEEHMDALLLNPDKYAHGSVKLKRGWRFVYVCIHWMPVPGARRH